MRRTRKQWFAYHLSRSVGDAEAQVRAGFRTRVEEAERRLFAARTNYAAAKQSESYPSRIAAFFGVATAYRRTVMAPLLSVCERHETELRAILAQKQAALQAAAASGEQEYREAHSARKLEAISRAERAVERKHEQRIRYLERSPAIRSAARFLKQLLVRQSLTKEKTVTCFYCGICILASDSHLEHKRPLSRGGDNRRGNLVLACAQCNLRKGRMTHEEYLRRRKA